jgi:hypothetical protein
VVHGRATGYVVGAGLKPAPSPSCGRILAAHELLQALNLATAPQDDERVAREATRAPNVGYASSPIVKITAKPSGDSSLAGIGGVRTSSTQVSVISTTQSTHSDHASHTVAAHPTDSSTLFPCSFCHSITLQHCRLPNVTKLVLCTYLEPHLYRDASRPRVCDLAAGHRLQARALSAASL